MIGKLHVGSNALLWRATGLATLSVISLLVWMLSRDRGINRAIFDAEI